MNKLSALKVNTSRKASQRATLPGALLVAILLPVSGVSHADSLDRLDNLLDSEFRTLSENVGAATHYKSFAPAEPLGTLGFDVAIELSGTDLDSAVFDKASDGGFEIGSFLLPRIHAHKGLPFNLDIGASLGGAPDTDFRVFGAEIRYAILEGSIATPALAIRLTYSKVSVVDDLEVDNLGAELTISKGFAMLTPYAGAGVVRTKTKLDVEGSPTREESFSQSKVFGGININLGFNFGLEVDVTGDYTTYGLKAGLRF